MYYEQKFMIIFEYLFLWKKIFFFDQIYETWYYNTFELFPINVSKYLDEKKI